MSDHPAPAGIAKRGITTVRDNLVSGQQVAGFARDFALLFRGELAARFLCGRKSCGDPAPGVSPAASSASAYLK